MPNSSPNPSAQVREVDLRRRLGVPDDAQEVIVLAESSHWDPNWLHTSEEYYRRFVARNLDLALAELQRESRRVYSVECVFFLRLYWERQPQRREAVRRLANEGRLRLTSSGVTTADTLLPEAEAILRDLLLGQEWLRAQGIVQEPRLAYFADSFGCSPALPSLLHAAGFDRTAFTRLDGMYFPHCDYEPRSRFPRAGSSAERLLKEERCLDFLWRGPDGAEVLSHWNAFGYSQGDLLAHRGLNRVYLFPVAVADRSEHNVARRIRQFAAQLRPFSRTPYLFCPIGIDFVSPIPGLVGLLDRYNQRRYPSTGLWAVNAGLDDYQALVDCYRDRLPVLELDPNPYWTGFYRSRPALKELCYDLVDGLLLAERLSLQHGNAAVAAAVGQELEGAWWMAVTANHHDFITGTSPDAVVEAEQRPWLEQARVTVHAAVARLAPAARQAARQVADPVPAPGRVEWRRRGAVLEVWTPHYVVELNEQAGGGIVHAWHPTSGQTLLDAVSNDLVSYRDSGGLWRMGHEFRGGVLKEVARTSARPVRLDVHEGDGVLEVTCEAQLGGEPLRRVYWFEAEAPSIRMQVEGRAAARRTVVARFQTGLSSSRLTMDQPGGVAVRPLQKIYDPTFWPVQHFLHFQDGASGRGVALLLRRPGAVACRPDGILEVVALRNATRERAFGLLPIPATAVTGHERSVAACDYALWFTLAGDWRDNNVAAAARRLAAGPWSAAGWPGSAALDVAGISVDRDDVFVTAVKPAWRGEGLMVRLQTFITPGPPVTLSAAGRSVEAAVLCDARERDLQPLDAGDGSVHLTMPGSIATVRLLF